MKTLTIGQLREQLAIYDPAAPVVGLFEGHNTLAPPLEIVSVVAEARAELANFGRYAAILVIRPEPVPEFVA